MHKYLYVFNKDGDLDYTRCRIWNYFDEEFLVFFHALTKH